MNHWEKGKRAEDLAARYLRARGYRIWKSNWRWGKKELDLVAVKDGELVIVEVKSRDGNGVNRASVTVDQRKQRNIVWATEAFIRCYNCNYPTRFDVIEVDYTPRGVELEHYRNAFYPAVE